MAKAKRERPEPYSFENLPPNLESAMSRFYDKQKARIDMRMQREFKTVADFADQAAYDVWKRNATYALFCTDEEIVFLAAWMSLPEEEYPRTIS